MPTETDKIKNDLRCILQDTGDAIVSVFDQMQKGKWTDDLGHDVQMNTAMLRLKDILGAMVDYRARNPWTLEAPDAD